MLSTVFWQLILSTDTEREDPTILTRCSSTVLRRLETGRAAPSLIADHLKLPPTQLAATLITLAVLSRARAHAQSCRVLVQFMMMLPYVAAQIVIFHRQNV
ncbi:hypothetical protein B0H16DRAFT_1481441 [Mycena metata]|uniref:Uncharacterized protein n=1 Tax=Mycena metata TaxID=1033252 RepID=A0AAD7MAB4_9AGAR|nr:hypothetical protein B0H16DRAFT_1481441 [Mycena metata]